MKRLIRIKRVYEAPETSDGFRILIDRLWPRGLTKEKAKIDLWLREIAPSTQLRKWFDHDPVKWKSFQQKYRSELAGRENEINQIREKLKKESVTLVYAAKDEEHNDAVVLQEYFNESLQ